MEAEEGGGMRIRQFPQNAHVVIAQPSPQKRQWDYVYVFCCFFIKHWIHLFFILNIFYYILQYEHFTNTDISGSDRK